MNATTAGRYDAILPIGADDPVDAMGRPLCGDCESPVVYDNEREQWVHAIDVECFLHGRADDLDAAHAVWLAAGRHEVTTVSRRRGREPGAGHEYQAVCSCGAASSWFASAGRAAGWDARHRLEPK